MTSSYQRNMQAAKVILSELYVKWATCDETIQALTNVMDQFLTAAERQTPLQNLPGAAELMATPIVPLSRSSTSRHVDPTSDTNFPLHNANKNNFSSMEYYPNTRGVSPPATPPSRSNHSRTDDIHRTPSPASASNRFIGVDELDHPHRGLSPLNFSNLSPSAYVKSVVDPMAPLPHVHPASTLSPTSENNNNNNNNNYSTGTTLITSTISPPSSYHGIDTSINAVMVTSEMSNSMDTPHSTSSTSQRYIHSTNNLNYFPIKNIPRATIKEIPLFYNREEALGTLSAVQEEEQGVLNLLFTLKHPNGTTSIDGNRKIAKINFGKICTDVFKIPLWLRDLLFQRIADFSHLKNAEFLLHAHISRYYFDVLGPRSPKRRIFELIRGDLSSKNPEDNPDKKKTPTNEASDIITLDDLKKMVMFLVDSHPGLGFLKQPEFQEYYSRTVSIRIMYALEYQQCRFIRWRDFEKSDLIDRMFELDEKDVNQVLPYFSYEHFYVLYCKFWELDTDRDQLISYDDLCHYAQGALCSRILHRVISGAGRKLTSNEPFRFDFEDFVYFCLSEEDKNTPSAIFYWFKVLDLDEDGILSGYELFEFFEENKQRLSELADMEMSEIASYEDMMCQMMDMLGLDQQQGELKGLRLSDLRHFPHPAVFFNMIFNAKKFWLFEQRNACRENDQEFRLEKTDWDRFAREEYDRMASEAQ